LESLELPFYIDNLNDLFEIGSIIKFINTVQWIKNN